MKRKAVLGNFLAVLGGLVLLGGIEGGLQLLDVGPSSRLFRPTQRGAETVYEVNREVAYRFFQRQYQRHVPLELRFSKTKPAGTVRIFVLGASTLIGFPNPVHTAFPHWLQKMLADAYPQRRFEVLNCGITAINSFSLVDFAQEIVNYDPDLIIFYAGHNEFMGPYGVTTPFLRFGNDRSWIRLHMHLQRSKIYYYLSELIFYLLQWIAPTEASQDFGLHLAQKEIGLFDQGYQTTVSNYRANLQDVLDAAQRHQITVVLSTLVSNLKDFHPLRSQCDAATAELQQRIAQSSLQETEKWAKTLLQENPYCANIHFELARMHYRRGAMRRARAAFVHARDMDRLPFRAPSVFNQIIRDLATEEVLLADVEQTFAAAAPHRIVGNELITEYVHPTVYGHYLIARTLLETLEQSPPATTWGSPQPIADYKTYFDQLDYPLEEQISRRNDLMLFLRKMPYTIPPPALHQSIATLIDAQLRDIPQLPAAARQQFISRGGLRFLTQMLDFLPANDRRALAAALRQLGSNQ
jgi:lysophospholipase L1-like esterase